MLGFAGLNERQMRYGLRRLGLAVERSP